MNRPTAWYHCDKCDVETDADHLRWDADLNRWLCRCCRETDAGPSLALELAARGKLAPEHVEALRSLADYIERDWTAQKRIAEKCGTAKGMMYRKVERNMTSRVAAIRAALLALGEGE